MSIDPRAVANAAAQDAFRRLVQRYVRTGVWDRHLFMEYQQAERELDRVEGEEALFTLTPDRGDHHVYPVPA